MLSPYRRGHSRTTKTGLYLCAASLTDRAPLPHDSVLMNHLLSDLTRKPKFPVGYTKHNVWCDSQTMPFVITATRDQIQRAPERYVHRLRRLFTSKELVDYDNRYWFYLLSFRGIPRKSRHQVPFRRTRKKTQGFDRLPDLHIHLWALVLYKIFAA